MFGLRNVRIYIIMVVAAFCASCSQNVSERSIGTLVMPYGVDAVKLDASQGGKNYAIVANTGDDSLAVADLDQQEFLDFVPGNTLRRNGLPLAGMPLLVKVAKDHGRAFVVTEKGPQVVAVDLPSFKELDRFALAPGASPDSFVLLNDGVKTYGLLSRPAEAMIEVVDLDAYKIVSDWYISGAVPRGLALCPDSSCLYMADSSGPDVYKLSIEMGDNGLLPQSASFEESYDAGGPTRRVAVDPTGRFLYCMRADQNSIAVIDLETGDRVDANKEKKALDEAEGKEHDLDIKTGAVPLEMNMVSYNYVGTAPDAEPEQVAIAFVLDYEGTLWGFDLTRDLHEIFDTSRTSYATVTKPVYHNADGTEITSPGTGEPSFKPIDPEDPEDPGVKVFYRVTRSETWTVVFDGVITGSYRQAKASLDLEEHRVVAPDANFVEAGIEAGDVITIKSPPVGDDCPLVGQEEPETVEMNIVEVHDTWLKYGDTDQPLKKCFAERELSFSIRTQGSFSVNGSVSGFKGRALPGVEYDNLLIMFTIEPPKDASAILEKGAGWSFTTSSGVDPLAVTIGSVPGGIAFSSGDPNVSTDDRILVTNRNFGGFGGSRGGLLEIDAQTFELLVQYY
ncbi:MAG: hypothetical protein GXP49_10205 [Deltaproteobacteria bacterium]|nr:hypothetical protein [Deltaproteobacteria bacterium]